MCQSTRHLVRGTLACVGSIALVWLLLAVGIVEGSWTPGERFAAGSPSQVSSAPSSWTKYSGNTALAGRDSPGFDLAVADPAVIRDSDGRFKMWYTASGYAHGDATPRPRIGYAASSDGVNWVRQDSPVLNNGPAGSWDAYAIETAWVLKASESPPLYHMYYAGYPSVNEKNQQQDVQIGLATSHDGVNWRKSPQNPILTIDKNHATNRWSSFGLWGPVVIKDGQLLKMWYLGVGPDASWTHMVWGIGYATSRDGISWVRNPEPILSADPNSYFKRLSDLSVLKVDSTYYLWLSASRGDNDNYEVWPATSSDGVTWNLDQQAPAVPRGPAGSWDAFNAFAPTVLKIGNMLWMWYHGNSVPDPYYLKIGLAVSVLPTPTPSATQ